MKNRKKQIEALMKEAQTISLVKEIDNEASEESSNSEEYADIVFNKLLNSIKIEGLDD